MKLERIEIKNYRSLFYDYDTKSGFKLDLGEGVNAILGPNNVGKSNVFRALSLALDPDSRFDRSIDMSAAPKWAKPVITLTFKVPSRGRKSTERTLLKYLDVYERAVRPGSANTFAARGIVKLRVQIDGAEDSAGTRRQFFVTNGAGARCLPDEHPLAEKAFAQFRKCLHFVMISSGQSLESLMEGKFRDILNNVLREDLLEEYRSAEESRGTYSSQLREGLLSSLSARIDDELDDLFPEIRGVELTPEVQQLDETLARMRIKVTDGAVTDLADKGTGVRGGLIVAILRYFADVGKRSMVFAVEEPESFLHPAAQEQLREDLEALAVRPDVSLLMSTHSPYVVSRRPDAKVFALEKSRSGGTRLSASARGDEPHAGLLGGLFRDRLFTEWLDRSLRAVDGEKGILVVEGGTDKAYAEIALRAAGREDLLDSLTILPAGAGQPDGVGGVALALMHAIVMNSVSPTPVAILLDNDGPGRIGAATLATIREKTKDWKERRTLHSYRHAFPNGPKEFGYEAEDLWPDDLIQSFLDSHPGEDFLTAKSKRPKPDGGWHYDLSIKGKSELVAFVESNVRAEHTARWVVLYEMIRDGLFPGAT